MNDQDQQDTRDRSDDQHEPNEESTTSSQEDSSGTSPRQRRSPGSKRRTVKRVSAVDAVKKATEQFTTLTSRTPESVVGVRWQDDHWEVRIEVVESRRIPDTADLLAEYEVELEPGGSIRSYDRKDRYVRGRPSE